ncbi:hypothetical protein IQ215_02475 [Cyanobacterium stanieri LEGE 03274]|uniref:Sulfotransferase domain-containing protein n=1 Tax=Cyanobacterium stanieri LEGE 03274 TaxID=1828756 RepID=A0ABR9V0Y9_9CHRO|nr:hypothetical protein [Cyanobacterium stanieri]MBE9221553.1 hypothetical protein [Cyanobacterium stanieri LEGE 03274]
MQFKNSQEYRIFGIKRSGNHAIINWIFSQCSNQTVFLNNCYPEGTKTLRIYQGIGRIDAKNINYWDYKQRIIPWEKNPFQSSEYVTYSKEDKRFKAEKLKQLKGKTTLVSFEDRDINKINSLFNQQHDTLIGNSNYIFKIVILRDPFNLLASIYKKWSEKDLFYYRNLWKEYANKFIEYEKSNDDYLLGISYNEWVKNKSYRQNIATKLGIPFNDQGKDNVTNFGGGSSFDGTSANKNATTMNVFSRWENFANDTFFCSLFKDEELWNLSEKIFGIIPRTDQLK